VVIAMFSARTEWHKPRRCNFCAFRLACPFSFAPTPKRAGVLRGRCLVLV
jgi:hypothetical protein